MAKNIEDIIVPERRKSIRNIPIPPRDRTLVPEEGRRKTDLRPIKHPSAKSKASALDGMRSSFPPPPSSEPHANIPPQPIHSHKRRRGARKRLLAASLLGGLILLFAVLSMFNGATLAYVPKSSLLQFQNETYSARKTGEGLLYSIVKLSGEKGVSVPTTGEDNVSRKASGTIVVYNNASTEPQTLVENTRFESPSGKIYRIARAITIPGKKTVNGASQPGSIEAVVFADQPGAEYNTGLTDFTVPGLKGTPRYSTVYARSKTPMSGGFVGKEKVVSKEDLTKAKAELQNALSQELIGKAQAEVPGDFILFPSLSSITFEDLPQTSANGNSATVNLRGSLYGIMFKKSDLALALGEKKVGVASNEPVEVRDFKGLNLSFAGAKPSDLLNVNEINFRVNGTALLVWRTDEVALKSDLVSRSKNDISSILKNYPTIATASATLRPFWKTSFPDDPEKISVKQLSVE